MTMTAELPSVAVQTARRRKTKTDTVVDAVAQGLANAEVSEAMQRAAETPRPRVGVGELADAGSFGLIPIGQIRESTTNPRKRFDGLAELAESITEKGILEPLIVRPLSPIDTCMLFELVVGARRLRAAKLAKLEVVPVIARELTDQQAMEIQVIENNQREDVHPLEEADGLAALVAMGADVETLAHKLGRPPRYVATRLRLGSLVPAARKLYSPGLPAEKSITLGHAVELARLPAKQQEQAAAMLRTEIHNSYRPHVPSLADLRRWLGQNTMHDLSGAVWKLSDGELLPPAGPCTTCLKNTANNTLLFEDVDAKKPTCTDPVCFGEKKTAFVKLRIASVMPADPSGRSLGMAVPPETDREKKQRLEKGPILLSESYGSEKSLEKTYGAPVVRKYNVETVSAKEAKTLKPEQVCPAVIVDGDEAGKTVIVRVGGGTNGQRGRLDAGARRERAARLAREKKARLQTDINQRIVAKCVMCVQAMEERELGVVLAGLWRRMDGDTQNRIAKSRAWERKRKDDYGWKEKAFAAWLEGETAVHGRLGMLVEMALTPAIRSGQYEYRNPKEKSLIDQAAEAWAVNVAAIRKEVEAGIGKSDAKPAAKSDAVPLKDAMGKKMKPPRPPRKAKVEPPRAPAAGKLRTQRPPDPPRPPRPREFGQDIPDADAGEDAE